MVGTRTSAIEPHIDDSVRNWVTRQLNERFDTLTNMINEMVLTQQFLVIDVNRLKSGEGSSRFSRMSKLEFPKFYNEDVKGWIYRVKQFFDVDGVRDEDKVKIVSIYIYDRALAWKLQFVRAQCENVTCMYIAGLPPTIEMNVRMFRPKTVADAFSLSNFQEITLALTKQRYTPLLPNPRTTYENMNTTYPANTTNRPKKWLTQKEIGEKRAKGLCFYCDRNSGHMFVLEVSPDEKENIEGNTDTHLEEKVENHTEGGELLLSECYASPQISLNAISETPTFNTMRMKAMVAKHLPHLLMDTRMTVARGNKMEEGEYTLELQTLLKEFEDVFVVLIELPPKRSCDHRIPLKDESTVVNIRPYRYPPNQKDVIETMVTELLDSGVIRSIIEELIDELQGAHIFSKLDLRSGYHQIMMGEEDIHKTSFKSHEGHYEFVLDDLFLSLVVLLVVSRCRQVLQTIRDHPLFAKQSKCVFGTTTVEYLGHIISSQGVATNPNKIKAMKSWPVQSNIKQLRGFLGLTRYYRRFIQGYAGIGQPLTALLKKNAFSWNNEAQVAFENLKQAMGQALVLALQNFKEEFIIETDTSGYGIGAVLQTKGHPIAFLSKTLALRHQSLPAYEKELLVVVVANGEDIFLIDILKLGLITSVLSKDNVVADALSRIQRQGELLTILISLPPNEFMDAINAMWTNDPMLSGIIKDLQAGFLVTSKYTWQDEQLKRKAK
ncbi:putative mitochondrial protein [Tanacetum coccineum]